MLGAINIDLIKRRWSGVKKGVVSALSNNATNIDLIKRWWSGVKNGVVSALSNNATNIDLIKRWWSDVKDGVVGALGSNAINIDPIERWWSGVKNGVVGTFGKKQRDKAPADSRTPTAAAGPSESWVRSSDRRSWILEEPRWFTAVLVLGLLGSIEALSWATSNWPLCLLVSKFLPSNQPGQETCATFSEGVIRLFALLWTHTDPNAVTAVAAIFIAGFTWMLWRSSERMWLVTHAAADAARRSADALVAAEQAQLVMVFGASNITHALTELGASTHSTSDETAPTERVFAQYVFKNYGRTLATLKEISHELAHWNRLPDALKYFAIPALPRERAIVAGASTESLQCTLAAPLTSEAAASIMRGDSFLWLYGHAVYDDVFGREHEHRFLYRYRIGPGFQPYYYAAYNRNI